MIQKSKPIRIQKIRDAARGETCTLQIPCVCNGNTETTVLAHLPDESHGMGRKSDDISAAFACSACHDVIDGRVKWELRPVDGGQWYMRRAMTRTLRRLIERGILK